MCSSAVITVSKKHFVSYYCVKINKVLKKEEISIFRLNPKLIQDDPRMNSGWPRITPWWHQDDPRSPRTGNSVKLFWNFWPFLWSSITFDGIPYWKSNSWTFYEVIEGSMKCLLLSWVRMCTCAVTVQGKVVTGGIRSVKVKLGWGH